MASVVFLITNVLYAGPATGVSLAVLALLGLSWFAVPLSGKVVDED